MISLRLLGIIFSILLFAIIWILHFRLMRLRNLDVLVGWVLSLVLLLVSLFPDVFNNVLSFFSFERGGRGRLIGLLIFSNLFLYVLVFSALLRNNTTEQTLGQLVRELSKAEFRKRHVDAKHCPIYVVIPSYNEVENIGHVLKQIPDEVYGLPVETLVVVDGATDATEEVVDSLRHVAIMHIINRGGAAALKAGYEVALERSAEIIVTLDADGQHMPEEIPILVGPIVDGEADLVNGSRVLGRYEKDNQLRAAGVIFFNWLVSILTMTRITDCSNAFRAIRASELGKLDLRQTQFHTSELLIEALKKGLRVKEVPITIRRRLSGESKKPPSLRYAWGFTKAIISTWLR